MGVAGLAGKKRKAGPSRPLHSLSIELAAQKGADGAPAAPSSFRIFKQGFNESTKGVFKFSDTSARRVMDRAKAYGNELAIDYAHGMFAFISADPAESGKAAGWFTPELREGELWAASVSWTPKAERMLLDREYRYISPTFDTDEAGEIHALHNVALTNIPALHSLEPLMASWAAGQPEADDEEETMDKALLMLLGLNENASQAEVLAALQRLQAPQTELLQLTAKANATEALGVVKAWKAAADSVPAMHEELTKLKTATLDARKEALIAQGKREGRVPPAYEPLLRTWELSQLEAFLKVAVPVHGTGGKATEPVDTTHATVALTAADREVMRLTGTAEKDFAAAKARRGGVVPVQETEA